MSLSAQPGSLFLSKGGLGELAAPFQDRKISLKIILIDLQPAATSLIRFTFTDAQSADTPIIMKIIFIG